MTIQTLFIDATFFLGMHATDAQLRGQSLAYFTQNLNSRPRMNYEQIGICDAVIWQCSRAVQDSYYPFMDRLHSDMAIQRGGYTKAEVAMSLARSDLGDLNAAQALLVCQVLQCDSLLASHDPSLLGLPCLRERIWRPVTATAASWFPEPLQSLYSASQVFGYDMFGR